MRRRRLPTGRFRGNFDGAALFARFNRAFLSAKDRSGFPIQIGVALPLTDPDGRGLPCEGEMQSLNQAEEQISSLAGNHPLLVGLSPRGV